MTNPKNYFGPTYFYYPAHTTSPVQTSAQKKSRTILVLQFIELLDADHGLAPDPLQIVPAAVRAHKLRLHHLSSADALAADLLREKVFRGRARLEDRSVCVILVPEKVDHVRGKFHARNFRGRARALHECHFEGKVTGIQFHVNFGQISSVHLRRLIFTTSCFTAHTPS